MRPSALIMFAIAALGAGSALAQVQPPAPPVACKPCWIEPWYCKAPPCPPPKPKPAPDQ
jgi:hypothetical protein